MVNYACEGQSQIKKLALILPVPRLRAPSANDLFDDRPCGVMQGYAGPLVDQGYN